MNFNKPIRTLLAMGALLTQSALNAQSWITVDDFKPGTAAAVTSDSQGNIYVAGYGTDAQGIGHATIMKSSDGGASWGIVEAFNDMSLSTTFRAIGTDAAGNVYATGLSMTVNNSKGQSGYWVVRKSSDQGTTWSTVDRFALPNNSYSIASAGGFGRDSLGNLYVVGTATVTQAGSQISHWIVRKSSNAGISWATVDDFLYGTGATPGPTGIICTSSGVFVSGGGYKDYSVGKLKGSVVHWLVRRSTNGGATWTTVDDYSYLQNQANGAFARAITADPAGNIYAFGNGATDSSHSRWLARKSSDNGATWSVVDDFLFQNDTCFAAAAGVDASGNIYAVGGARNHWLVRTSNSSGANWSLVDDFQYSPGNYASFARGFGTSPTGALFAVGQGTGPDGSHWIVRAAAP
jgi:hypothetical protein